MAKVGRKPKPTALKLIEGNPGGRQLNEAEPKPIAVFQPPAPEHFNYIEEAKWHEMTAKLAAVGVLTELDLDALELYVIEWVAMFQALTDLRERGKMLRTANGSTMWNPSWAQYKHSQKVCRSLQSEFGLTPSSRTGIVAEATDDTGKDVWADF